MTEKLTRPPLADQRSHSYERHGYVVNDPWHWLKDPRYPVVEDEDILAYLKAENQWFEQNMADRKPLTETLFQEMKARIKEDDSSVPQRDGDWIYWSRFEEGMQYRQHWRKAAAGGEDQLMLDENILAKGKEYFRLGAASVSPDGRLLAYAYDDNGSERFEVRFKDLDSGELLPDVIPGTLSSLVWSADSRNLLYGLANEQWRTDNARLHVLGSDIADDVELYHEDDEGFRVGIGLTHSEKYIAISSGDHETSEVRLVPTDNPLAEPILVSARRAGREYEVEEHDGTLYILTNDNHVNFRLVTASIESPSDWTSLIAGSDDFYLTDVCTFKNFYVTEGRENGLDQIAIRSYDDPAKIEYIAFPEASYSAGLDDNPEYDVDKLRIGYDSMITPGTVYDYHLTDKSLETLKVQEIPSGYDASQYQTERLMIAVRDGTLVPVSLVYHNDTKIDGSAPLHLYSYGAYGYAVPPSFSTTRLSLVDRGFVYAIAHIRGGDDL
ncbi:MAG: S9 family peptidase, partial [Parasphingorhabdus sp.]